MPSVFAIMFRSSSIFALRLVQAVNEIPANAEHFKTVCYLLANYTGIYRLQT